jgi:hypothetical protein
MQILKLLRPWLWGRKAKPAKLGPAPDLAQHLYRTLIEIRDHPKHARRKVVDALQRLRPWRCLYRAVLDIQLNLTYHNPGHALELANAAISETRIAMLLHGALIHIKHKPKQAREIASEAITAGAKLGAQKLTPNKGDLT